MDAADGSLVIAIICDYEPDAVAGQRPKILDSVGDDTKLSRAIHNGRHFTEAENPADIVLVLSSSEEVLEQAAELGAATYAVPSMFAPKQMVETYFTAGTDIFLDPTEDPMLVIVDPETGTSIEVSRLRAWMDREI